MSTPSTHHLLNRRDLVKRLTAWKSVHSPPLFATFWHLIWLPASPNTSGSLSAQHTCSSGLYFWQESTETPAHVTSCSLTPDPTTNVSCLLLVQTSWQTSYVLPSVLSLNDKCQWHYDKTRTWFIQVSSQNTFQIFPFQNERHASSQSSRVLASESILSNPNNPICKLEACMPGIDKLPDSLTVKAEIK